jgi:hypothetical protein
MTVRSEQRTIYTTTCDLCGTEEESEEPRGAMMMPVHILDEYKHACGNCWDKATDPGGSQWDIHRRVIAAYEARQKELGA